MGSDGSPWLLLFFRQVQTCLGCSRYRGQGQVICQDCGRSPTEVGNSECWSRFQAGIVKQPFSKGRLLEVHQKCINFNLTYIYNILYCNCQTCIKRWLQPKPKKWLQSGTDQMPVVSLRRTRRQTTQMPDVFITAPAVGRMASKKIGATSAPRAEKIS